ncbi:c-type cytochrome [Pararhizobium arenae]|uniref:c-type cytochrome n=1 Tax=Pararhizobium arenae TaxID=1856850 RepID=UPI00094AA7E0|nr:c-type cytochrome [Pararhizobium arenae]
MTLDWKRISAALLALAAAGVLFAWAGLLDVRASTGHWRVTDWFLHWVMRSSVRTASLGKEPPAFTPAMLPLAAGHYEIGCAGCHGSPALPPPVAAQNMLPPPPDMNEVSGSWSDAELFEIVRHGVRYTGMPAWPAPNRDDEVWAMVAFLRAYPQIDSDTYRRLAGFSATQSRDFARVLQTCEGCHSSERLDRDSLIPRLSGQSEAYLRDSLEAFVSGRRPSGVMRAALSQVAQEDRQKLAMLYANQPLTDQIDGTSVERGKTLAQLGDRERGIPACTACHDRTGANPAYPQLAGQSAPYLQNQLRLFKAGTRGGGPFAEIMTKAATGLSIEDIKALAAYYSTLSRN